MRKFKLPDEVERAWWPLTRSNLPYSIKWNTRTSEVKVVLPNGRIVKGDPASNARAAELQGEKVLANWGFKSSLEPDKIVKKGGK